MIVASYLIRMEPFTQHFLKLQVCWFKCTYLSMCDCGTVFMCVLCVREWCSKFDVGCCLWCVLWQSIVYSSILYNWKYQQSLDLVVWLKLGVEKILVKVKFGGGTPASHYIIISIARVCNCNCTQHVNVGGAQVTSSCTDCQSENRDDGEVCTQLQSGVVLGNTTFITCIVRCSTFPSLLAACQH